MAEAEQERKEPGRAGRPRRLRRVRGFQPPPAPQGEPPRHGRAGWMLEGHR